MAGEAANMQLIDDGVLKRSERRRVLLPIERPAKEKAPALCRLALMALHVGRVAPRGAVGNSCGSGVKENEFRIELMARSARPVHAPAVSKCRWQTRDKDVPMIASPIL